MKISVNSINSYLEKPLKTQEMAETLERTEVEVEEILYANQLDDKIIVAKVAEVTQHPNADKLKLAKVETDAGTLDTVCGAPNIAKNMRVALAQVGTTLPSGDVIGEAVLRGEKSQGMLCSAMELGWGDDHSGLIELDPNLPLGTSLCDIAKNSDIIDIKTPTNRWDYMSIIGLAREISAVSSNNRLIEPVIDKNTYNDREVAKVNNKQACTSIYLAKLRVKENIQSPKWLVDNLQAAGMRSINPVVDITNFVMLEYGQPTHAYDAKKIKSGIGVRFAKPGESLTTLDGSKLKLTELDLVIVDKSGPIGLAGVMGGINTETSHDTSEIILEAASFDKTTVRRSALRHGLRTEASARFEKGLPLPLPQLAMDRIIGLLRQVCSAEIIDSPTCQLYSPIITRHLGMRVRKAERFLGYKLDEKELMVVLASRGFKPDHFSLTKEFRNISQDTKQSTGDLAGYIYGKAGVDIGKDAKQRLKNGMEVPKTALKAGDLLFDGSIEAIYTGNNKIMYWDKPRNASQTKPLSAITKSKSFQARRFVENFNHIVSVEAPWWRDDIQAEVDLFEEVAKSIGYDKMPETLAELPPTDTSKDSLLPHLMELRQSLSAYGLNEIMTYSFVSKEDVIRANLDSKVCLQIENPLNSEQDLLRSSMVSSHLRAVSKNQKVEHNAVYEISRVYKSHNKSAIEEWKLGITFWGENSLLRLKGAIDQVLYSYRLDPEIIRALNNKLYHPNRSAILGSGFGVFGQINQSVLDKFGIKKEVSFAELSIKDIIDSVAPIKVSEPIPYQIIKKDISLELKNMVTFYEVRACLKGLVSKASFKQEFTSEELNKSASKRMTVTVELDLGPNPKSEDIQDVINKCSSACKQKLQAKVL
jgi:phenylalanyl-tRNA synthetase beta subunit